MHVALLVPGWRNGPEYFGEGWMIDAVVVGNLYSLISECGEEIGDENGEKVELDPWLLLGLFKAV